MTLYLAYATTVVVLAVAPGPSTMLGTAHGMTHGALGTLPTIAGDLTANTLQMVAAAAGLGALIVQSRGAFLTVKWVGVAYLLWLAGQYWFADPPAAPTDDGADEARPPWARYAQGFVTSASNPKAVVFFAALFPQFIDSNGELLPQFLVLGATFLVIDGAAVLAYAAAAGRLARWLGTRGRARLLRRTSGAVVAAAAAGLALKGLPARSS